jgi:hypothetical protein
MNTYFDTFSRSITDLSFNLYAHPPQTTYYVFQYATSTD